MKSLQLIVSKLPCFILLMLLSLIVVLTGCGGERDTQMSGFMSQESGISTSLPSSLQKDRSGLNLTAELVIDDGAPILLTIDFENQIVSGTPIKGLLPGTHTLTISYYLDGTLVATATASAEVVAGQTTNMTPDMFQLDEDLDEDGFKGIDEVLSGKDPNNADDMPQAPNGMIDTPIGDQQILVGATVNFTGTATDPDGDTALTYLWDFGGGAATATVEEPGLVTFNNPGVYTITFIVTDSLGIADPRPDERTITVTNQAPNGVIDTPTTDQTIIVGNSVNFTGTATDPDGDTAFTYTWEFDGGANNVTDEDPGPVIFDTPGIYTVTFTVKDNSGLVDPTSDKRTITVTNIFAYVANTGSGSVTAYRIDVASGALTKIADVNTGSSPESVTVDPTGKFAYVAIWDSRSVTAYRIDAASGALTKIADVNTGNGPRSVIVDPTGKFVYVANLISESVTAYRIDVSSGALTKIADVNTGSNPISVTVDPTGKFAYVANWASDSVTAYTIDAAGGALTKIADADTGSLPYSVTVDPTGKFAYVANSGSDSVTAYTIDATSGALMKIADVDTGSSPESVTVDPTGKFAYVANNSFNSVTAYRIDAAGGALTKIADVDTGNGPVSITIDPTGKFAYVANSTSDSVTAYTIDATSGVLTEIGTTDLDIGSRPVSITISPPAE